MKSGDSAYVVGFGRTLYSKMSPIKQKLRLPIYDHEKCRSKFAAKSVQVTDDQLCAGGEFTKDACDGGELLAKVWFVGRFHEKTLKINFFNHKYSQTPQNHPF